MKLGERSDLNMRREASNVCDTGGIYLARRKGRATGGLRCEM